MDRIDKSAFPDSKSFMLKGIKKIHAFQFIKVIFNNTCSYAYD